MWAPVEVVAGVAPSIVPARATARLRWIPSDRSAFESAVHALCPSTVPDGYSCEARPDAVGAMLTVTGRAAHSGMNIEGGRNALVLLANALHRKLAPTGATDLLEFAVLAGKDLHGGGLGLTQQDPLWGRCNVNVATLKPADGGKLVLTTNLRRIPLMTHKEIKAHLEQVVATFNRKHEAKLEVGGYFQDEPFVVSPEAKLVRRLLGIYERATGRKARPVIAGGATYAKRLPNAVAFGMWFPGKPYPGHDVDERIPTADLHLGVDVLLEALHDLTSSEPIADPLLP